MAWYPHTVTVAPASEPVTLGEAKAQCRVDGTDSDTLLAAQIAAARSYVEDYCGRALVARTVTVKCDSFDDFAVFPVVPLSSVTSVSYVDSAGASQTLSADVYEVRSDGLTASVALKHGQSWPSIQSGSRITVTAVVGGVVPEAVKQALLLLIGHFFSNREAVSVGATVAETPIAVSALLANHRSFAF